MAPCIRAFLTARQTFQHPHASRPGIRCEYDGVPDEAFMILVLKDDALAGIWGVARYRPEFSNVA